MDLRALTRQPLFFDENRVYRVYRGGKLLDRFLRRRESGDGNYPEEWMASTVRAMNDASSSPDEGLSVIAGTAVHLKRLGEAYPAETYGPAGDFRILVKCLDSAIRLPIQAHPDKAFARRYFHSEFGKTEMWLILATREEAGIYFGFKERMTKADFSELASRSRTEKQVMDDYLNRVEVKVGEVYLIPARTVHAIGYGCLILEVQEPTDFTISPEFWCGDRLLSEKEMYLGLTKEQALDCFDYSVFGPECVALAKKEARVLAETKDLVRESLISEEDSPCFQVLRSTIRGRMELHEAPAIHVVTEGFGRIVGTDFRREIGRGDYFFMPFGARSRFWVEADDTCLCVATCLPPGAWKGA